VKLKRLMEMLKQFDDDLEVEFCCDQEVDDDIFWFKPVTTVETKFGRVDRQREDEDLELEDDDGRGRRGRGRRRRGRQRMNTLLTGDVKLPGSRQRSSVSDSKFHELKESIKREGLFHAIILSEGNLLVAGFTRLKAISEIYTETGQPILYDGEEVPFGQVPYTLTHKTDPASLFRIELEENLRRENLTPLDEAQALAGLHHLLQSQAPELIAGTGIRAQVTVKETAKVLGEITGESKTTDQHRISGALIVERFKDDPGVKRAKSLKEAVAAAKKAAERTLRNALGTAEADIPRIESRHQLIVDDCEHALAAIPDGVIDCIIADPPYGIGADSFGEQSKIGHNYEDDEQAFFRVLNPIFREMSRICKPQAAAFIFLDIRNFERVCSHPDRLNIPDWYGDWYIWPTPLIWYKFNRGHAPQPDIGPSRRYEAILYAVRGGRKVRKVGSDVLMFAVPDDRQHAAEKPSLLYEELLSWIVYPGDLVLDPCAGSGTVVPAADSLDCSAIAIERDPAHATIISERINVLLSGEGEVDE
jgi:DNA modification methylase/ParB-like chromosome segregation protein Spo0J